MTFNVKPINWKNDSQKSLIALLLPEFKANIRKEVTSLLVWAVGNITMERFSPKMFHVEMRSFNMKHFTPWQRQNETLDWNVNI